MYRLINIELQSISVPIYCDKYSPLELLINKIQKQVSLLPSSNKKLVQQIWFLAHLVNISDHFLSGFLSTSICPSVSSHFLPLSLVFQPNHGQNIIG